MARRLIPGTPSRAKSYVYPRRLAGLFLVPLLAGVTLALLAILFSLSGSKPLGSPGPVAAAHAAFEGKCASCHGPRVAVARCEHCHDPRGSRRLDNAGHERTAGARFKGTPSKAEPDDCARCHTDHRGRSFSIARSDDRQCRNCHFSSFAAHPEFSLVKAKTQAGEGIEFSHKVHLKAIRKAKLDDCLYCHEPTKDRRSFLPLNFDSHCASCHLTDGTLGATDPIPAAAVIRPQDIKEPWARMRPEMRIDGKGLVTAPAIAHRDPWILFNLSVIARQVDPDGAAARRARAKARVEELTAQLSAVRPVKGETLSTEEKRLSANVSRLAARPVDDRERERARKALERVRLTIELGPAPMAGVQPLARSQLEASLRATQSELSALGEQDEASTRLSEAEKSSRLAAVAPLTAPCTLCHVFDGPWMQPVAVPANVLSRAHFSHLPHFQQLPCVDCHRKAPESRKSSNVLVPEVAVCGRCHRPGANRSDCAECHTYHPKADPWPPI